MTLEEVRAESDARFAALLPQLAAAQETYRAQAGRYVQLLPTHGTPPADGQETPPDATGDHPTDQAASWDTFGGLPALMLTSCRVDEYLGPQGPGWVCVREFTWEGVRWQHAHHHGPETQRAAQDWHAVVEVPEP